MSLTLFAAVAVSISTTVGLPGISQVPKCACIPIDRSCCTACPIGPVSGSGSNSTVAVFGL